jgi:hypothetical protein
MMHDGCSCVVVNLYAPGRTHKTRLVVVVGDSI